MNYFFKKCGFKVFLGMCLIPLCCTHIHSGVGNALDSIQVITVKSKHQKIIKQNVVELEGDVELQLDHKIHVWADYIILNKVEQTIVARTNGHGFVKLENPDFVMLADYIELHLATKTGCAKQIKIHVKDGFISAEKAEKIDEQTWEMEGLTYTSCDHTTPHWAFKTSHAVLYRNSVLKASGLFFKIMGIPLIAFPGLIFPLQDRAGTGLLMPRLSFDAELGFGFRQEYYWLIGSHCDTTFGFNLVQKKGFILSDEFRWAQSPENFLIATSYYAKEWNAWLERQGRIVKATDKRYWIQGRYFQPFSLGSFAFQSLIRFDFGTDKRLGYHFLNDIQQVEDSFYNSVIQRYRDRKHIMQCMVHSERSLRKQFDELGANKKEREEKVSVVYLPHYEWSTVYHKLVSHLFYRHDMVFDHAFLESRNVEKLYVGSLVDQTLTPTRCVDSDTTRFLYRGRIESSWRLLDQQITAFVEPYVQVRSNIKKCYASDAHHKVFASVGVEWAMPEAMTYTDDFRYVSYVQPMLRWRYLPKFYQQHWHYIDKFDRFYPENSLTFSVRNTWQFEKIELDLLVSQAYDFYNRSDIFPLHKSFGQQHLGPFELHAQYRYKGVTVSVDQEYNWRTGTLDQSELMATVTNDTGDFFIGYVYQNDLLRATRELFSDIPSFAIVGASVALGKSVRLTYNGKFYSTGKRPKTIPQKPLLHTVRLDYKGHCWGISLGWEEKRYRQYGNWKSERAITLALRLESIGSFAQKFKRPVLYRAPASYLG